MSMSRTVLATRIATVTVVVALGCGVADQREVNSTGEYGGTVVITSPAEPATLFPATAIASAERAVIELIFERLAEPPMNMRTVGDAGFEPRIAQSWTWASDSLSIAFHLNPKARWHDGVPVRAADVRFTYRIYGDRTVGSPSLQLLSNLDSVTVRDSLTAVIWFRRHSPEQFYEATYNTLILPEHLLAATAPVALATSEFVRHPIGTGRFRFSSWTPGQRLELDADTLCYRGRALLDRVVWTYASDPIAAATKLFAGEADFHELLTPTDVRELPKHPTLRAYFYPAMGYYYLGFNLTDPASRGRRPHPLFSDRSLRRAIAMGINREAMLKNVFDTLALSAIGPVTRAVWTADTTVHGLPFAPDSARRVLDSLGWKIATPDGLRYKKGRPLRFSITVPTSSSSRVRYATLMQEQLRQIGAQVDIEATGVNAVMARMSARSYDALLGGWGVDPSPGALRQTWSGKAASEKDGSNSGSYVSAKFDALVDSATAQFDSARGKAYFSQAYRTIVDDAAAVFLYELRPVAAAHRRIRVKGLRGDAWWAGLPDWSIDPAQRLDRDRIGLRGATN
ncbi:MAG: peptide-binding protein [Gemmatimonadaceae bacterium]